MFGSLLIRSLLFLIMIATQGCETPQPTPSALTHPPPKAGLQESDVWSGGFWDPSYFQAKQIWGYVNKHSIVPGEVFDLMLSTGPGLAELSGQIEVYRIGVYDNDDRKLFWKSQQVNVPHQPVDNTAGTIGPNWVPMVQAIPTDSWPSGYYTVDFVRSNDYHRDPDIAYIVVTNPKRSGDILVKLSTNTYQAYNTWGGHSFYRSAGVGKRGHMIAFDRPTPPAFQEYEYYLVLWLEKLAKKTHIQVDYATDFDLHHDARFATDYQVFISGAHDEYWSKEEFDHLYHRIFDLGKNTIFWGGNTAYFQVRYADVNRLGEGEDRGRQLICYKDLQDPIRHRVPSPVADLFVTARFRDGARRPETMLLGVGFQAAFNPSSDGSPWYPYYVESASLPFFADTGLQKGDSIGNLVGYEWDNTDPTGDGTHLWDPKTSRIPFIQSQVKTFTVLFQGSPVDSSGQTGRAEGVYFESKAGAKVFNAGSIRWVWGLGKPGFENEQFNTLNENLILFFLGS